MSTPLLRPDDVAEILNISARQVRRLAAAGEIPHVIVGTMYRFDRADIERWITDERGKVLGGDKVSTARPS